MIDLATPLSQPLEHLLERFSSATVFGPPTTVGEHTVIPVCSATLGLGLGAGTGPAGPGANGQPLSGGGGGGGGGGGRLNPRGYIKLGPKGVSYEPIMHQSLIALAGIAMIAWNVFWITLTVRSVVKARQARLSALDGTMTGDGDSR